MSNNDWYSNKELFEQINAFQKEFTELRAEMRETRAIIKKYNGLREEIGQVKERVDAIELKQVGKASVGKAIREWGGWIVGVLGLIAAYSKLFM